MKTIARYSLATIMLYFCFTSMADPFKYEAWVLKKHLALSNHVTSTWQAALLDEVSRAKDNPEFIEAVCPLDSACARSPYPFDREIRGLDNILALDKVVIENCYGQTVQCIVDHDETRMFSETRSQTEFELKRYLWSIPLANEDANFWRRPLPLNRLLD